MQLHEAIYTSAPELLDGGTGNLGVVARTRGFPSELESELSAYRSYMILDDLPIDSVQLHPPRLVIVPCGKAKRYLLISQTVFAGADYTGRTRPLSHQVLISFDEIERSHNSVAELVSAVTPLMRNTWDEKPQWIDPPRTVALSGSPLAETCSPFSASASGLTLSECLIVSVADTLITFPQHGQAIVMCLPREKASATVELAIQLLSLLPPSIQRQLPVASHIVDIADCPRNSALLFTYPGTPFLAHTIERQDPRKPLVFDLTHVAKQPYRSNGPYSQALAISGEQHTCSQCVVLAKRWDEWGFASQDTPLFPKANELYMAIASATTAAQLTKLGQLLQQTRDTGLLSTLAEQWCNQAVERLGGAAADARWDALAAIQLDSRWPDSARAQAQAIICTNWKQSLPYYLAHRNQTLSIERYFTLLDSICAQPNVAEQAVAIAVADTTPSTLELASLVCKRMPWNLEGMLTCVTQLSAAPQKAQELLRPLLLKKAAKNVRRIDEVRRICDSAIARAAEDRAYGREVCEIVLHPKLERTQPGPVRDNLCRLLLDTAVSCRLEGPELQWLENKLGSEGIASHVLDAWRAAVGGHVRPTVANSRPPDYHGVSNELTRERKGDWNGLRLVGPTVNATDGVPFFVSWLFPACIALFVAETLTFLLFVTMNSSFTWAELKGIASLQSPLLFPVLPAVAWGLFEITVPKLFPGRWKMHAASRGVLLLVMTGSVSWMAVKMVIDWIGVPT